MNKKMVEKIGKILVNLLTLEFSLRLLLDRLRPHDYPTNNTTTSSFNFSNHIKGTRISENYLTNYDSLNKIIKKTNEELEKLGINDRIDSSVVELRDAFAHGRIISKSPNSPFRLFKFSKPNNKMVKVTNSFEMTSKWLDAQIKHIKAEVTNVINISKDLGFDIFHGNS